MQNRHPPVRIRLGPLPRSHPPALDRSQTPGFSGVCSSAFRPARVRPFPCMFSIAPARCCSLLLPVLLPGDRPRPRPSPSSATPPAPGRERPGRDRAACRPRSPGRGAGSGRKHIRRTVKRGDLLCSDTGTAKRPNYSIARSDIAAWMESHRLRTGPAKPQRDALVDKYFPATR